MPSEKAYWLLQGEKSHRIPVLIAHSVVNCNSAGDIFPARLLNSRSEAVTLFKGTRIGTLEPLQEDAISGTDAVETLTVNSVLDAMPEMSPEKDQLLQKLVQDSTSLSSAQQDQLYLLLQAYGDIFAEDDTDLGRTKRVNHKIDTGTSAPIRHHPRRIPFANENKLESCWKRC